jgi:hypothetical protein
MEEPSRGRLRARTWMLYGFCAIFIGVQFIRPELRNIPARQDLNAPFEVKQILHNSCYSCHSNQTRLPWFDKVAPAYWLVTRDVNEGRKHLNFSEIARLPVAQQNAVLFVAVNEIQSNAMPLPAYRLLHPGSVITRQELAVLTQYLKQATLNKANAATDQSAGHAQYKAGLAGQLHRKI